MKKILILFVIALFGLCLVGCGENNDKGLINNFLISEERRNEQENEDSMLSSLNLSNENQNIQIPSLIPGNENQDIQIPPLLQVENNIVDNQLIIMVKPEYKEKIISENDFIIYDLIIEKIEWLNEGLYKEYMAKKMMPNDFINVYCITFDCNNFISLIENIKSLDFVYKVSYVMLYDIPNISFTNVESLD